MADAAEAIATDANVRYYSHPPSAATGTNELLEPTYVFTSLSWSNVQVVDLLVAMVNAAAHSTRCELILDPFPSIVDPDDSGKLALDPAVGY